MRKKLSGHDDEDFVHRISDHLAVGMDSRVLHLAATWKNGEEDD